MQKLTIDDIDRLKPYIEKANYNEYNSNVVTMMMWQFSYPTSFEIQEHFAVVKWHFGEQSAWMMPLCDISHRKEAMQYMLEYSSSHHEPFIISSAIEEFKLWCQKEYKDTFVFEDYEDAQDYVYLVEPQVTLSGKKMQKRRNHYNAFIKENEQQFEYVKLENISDEQILNFLDEWNSQHEVSESLRSEKQGITFLLKHRKELELLGGGLFIHHELKAFLIASKLSSDTLEIHVEKAQRDIRGLYIAMLKHFLMEQDTSYQYINREDDMGLESLRTAKMNMHPLLKIKKCGIVLKNTNIRQAEPDDIKDLKILWQESFLDETQETTDFYFQHLYKPEECFVLTQDDMIVSMLQTRKMQLMIQGSVEPTSFIVGVATTKRFQHNHFMKMLMESVLLKLKQEEKLTVLQAYDWDLYKPFGFQVSHYLQKVKLEPCYKQLEHYTIRECHDASALLEVYTKYCAHKNGYRIRDLKYYEQYLLPYVEASNGVAYLVYDQSNKPVGSFLLYDHIGSEFLPLNDETNQHMQAWLCEQYKDVYVIADVELTIAGERVIMPSMMSAIHKDIVLEEPLFISEVL